MDNDNDPEDNLPLEVLYEGSWDILHWGGLFFSFNRFQNLWEGCKLNCDRVFGFFKEFFCEIQLLCNGLCGPVVLYDLEMIPV